MEHWLPLFYDETASLFDYLSPDALICLQHLVDEACADRTALVADYYQAREEAADAPKLKNADFAAPAYRALAPNRFYLDTEEFRGRLAERPSRRFSPFSPPDGRRAYSLRRQSRTHLRG